jgi:hypothetical protein
MGGVHRRDGLCVTKWLLAAFVLMLAWATPAAADVYPLEVQEYRTDFGVSAKQAEAVLQAQYAGAEADIAGQLEGRLGSRYAGVWFDNESGEFVVPLLGDSLREDASTVFGAAGLEDAFRTAPAQASWTELEAAQEQLNRGLSRSMAGGVVETAIDPRRNSVVIDHVEGIGKMALADLQKRAADADVDVEVRGKGAAGFHPVQAACSNIEAICDAPLRGGVALSEAGSGVPFCTAGFKAIGVGTGDRYVLTAGHCALDEDVQYWSSSDTRGTLESQHYLGFTEGAFWGSGYDAAKINATGTEYWDKGPWPNQVAEWDQGFTYLGDRPMSAEGSSFIGQYVCHTGRVSGSSCGPVTEKNVSITIKAHKGTPQEEALTINHLVRAFPTCTAQGDSGGPVYAGNTALGLTGYTDDALESCHTYNLFTEIIEDTDLLGVSVAPRITQTSVESATAMNGSPGWATVRGHVYAPYGAAINNAHVDIKLFKWEGSSYVQKATLQASVNNSAYELSNWNGVGPGTWVAKVVFPAQGGLGESSSNVETEGQFTVKNGYQLVNKYSGKCLDVEASGTANGVSLQQWDCGNPASAINQVFTLVPRGNSYYQLVARNSGRCLDVVNGSQSNGAWVQQWDCLGDGQLNQIWLGAPLGSYTQFRAKHDDKCLEIGGPTFNNGAKAQQWSCLGESQANQLWSFKSVTY